MNELSMRLAVRPVGWVLTVALALAAPATAQPTSVGLSTVRSVRFGNDNLSGIFTPEAGDHFAYSLAVGDFDGDGADDLATGMPYDNGFADSPIVDSGSVVVRYSSVGGGLTTNPSQVYIRQSGPVDGPSADDWMGYALAACDFSGDGKDDLAIGVPAEDVNGEEDAGTVEVHLGSSSGVHQVADFVFTQNGSGIPGEVEAFDGFGLSLACGDFDRDGFADLVVGVPLETFEPTIPCGWLCTDGQGMVVVIPGRLGGLDFQHATALHQDVDGILGDGEPGDFFGSAFAVGDFDGDTFDDLAIGVSNEDDEGVVQVVFGSAGGLTPEGNLMWSQSFLGGSSEDDDWFGDTLAAGDFDGNGVDDIAIGVSKEDFGSTADVGQVHVVYGFPGGLDPATAEIWTQDNVFGAGNSEVNDRFGFALAAGDFDHDGRDDLAIGSPGEYQTTFAQGSVGILMGTSEGLSSARRRGIAPGFDGFPGPNTEQDVRFGASLAAGDFDGDGHADLAIGAPDQNDPGTPVLDVGSETVLYGSLFADGVENGDTGYWSQTVQPPTSNRVKVTAAAKLGPNTSKLGLQFELTGPTPRQPGPPVFVRVGPEAGFQNETHLAGTFFVDPRALTMSPAPGQNIFQMVAFKDGRDITRLTFDLNRNDAVGGWALIATFFNETTGALTFANGAGFAGLNEPPGTSHRIDFDWTAGDPGQLTVWHITYVDGVPDRTGRVQLFSVALAGMRNASISNVLAGMVEGQDPGTFGALYLDELSFRR
jgi:FG-GAP repeat protein